MIEEGQFIFEEYQRDKREFLDKIKEKELIKNILEESKELDRKANKLIKDILLEEMNEQEEEIRKGKEKLVLFQHQKMIDDLIEKRRLSKNG